MKKTLLIIGLLLGMISYGSAQKYNEMINLGKYTEANSQLPVLAKGEKRVVFIGNSITEAWVVQRPEFFASNNYVGRGISGQTSPQLLSRFRQDVIDLHPVAVVINVGTNDVAQNTGEYNPDFTLGNIISMAELAKANGIKVILSSVLPAGSFSWSPEIIDVPYKIKALNIEIEAYAKKNKFPYIDYYSQLHDNNGAMKKGYGDDGVHPNSEAYNTMELVAKPIIDKAIK